MTHKCHGFLHLLTGVEASFEMFASFLPVNATLRTWSWCIVAGCARTLDAPFVHMLHWKDLGDPTAVSTQEADARRLEAIGLSSLLTDCKLHCSLSGDIVVKSAATVCFANHLRGLHGCTKLAEAEPWGRPTKSHDSQDFTNQQGIANSLWPSYWMYNISLPLSLSLSSLS